MGVGKWVTGSQAPSAEASWRAMQNTLRCVPQLSLSLVQVASGHSVPDSLWPLDRETRCLRWAVRYLPTTTTGERGGGRGDMGHHSLCSQQP